MKWRRDWLLRGGGGCGERRTSRRKVWGNICAIWEQVVLQRNELPVTGDCAERILARGGPQRPSTQSRDPSSDFLSDGLCPQDTRERFQPRLPRREPSRAGLVHQLSKGERKPKPPASGCPQAPGLAEPSRKLLLTHLPVHWCFPGVGAGRPAEQKGSNISWQSSKRR